jgi:mandelamide amidase
LPAAGLKGTKLGISRRYFFSGLDSEVERVTNDALRKLQNAGAELVEADVPELQRLIDLTTIPIQNHDARYALRRYLEGYKAGITLEELIAKASIDIRRDFHDLLPGGRFFVPDNFYAAAVNVHLPRLKETYRNNFAQTRVTAIVFPTTMVPPPLIGDDVELTVGGKKVPFETAVARNIAPGSTAGIPGLVLPAGTTTGGLPIALEFDALAGSDRLLLALGISVERVLGKITPLPCV